MCGLVLDLRTILQLKHFWRFRIRKHDKKYHLRLAQTHSFYQTKITIAVFHKATPFQSKR